MKHIFLCLCIPFLCNLFFACERDLPQPQRLDLPEGATFHVLGSPQGEFGKALLPFGSSLYAIGDRQKVGATPRFVSVLHGLTATGDPSGHSVEFPTLGTQTTRMALNLDDTSMVLLLRHSQFPNRETSLLWWLGQDLQTVRIWTPDSADVNLLADAVMRDGGDTLWLAGNTTVAQQDEFFVLKVSPDGQDSKRQNLEYGGRVGGIHALPDGRIAITGARLVEGGWRHAFITYDPIANSATPQYIGPAFHDFIPVQSTYTNSKGYFLLATVVGSDGKEHISIAHFNEALAPVSTWTMTADDQGSSAGALTYAPDGKLLVVGSMRLGDANLPDQQSLLLQMSMDAGGFSIDSTWIYGGSHFDAAVGVAVTATNQVTVLSTSNNGTDNVMHLMTYPY